MRFGSPQHREERTGELIPFPRRPQRRSALGLWHLLSLDAPTVAAVWVVFVARCAHVSLPWSSPVSMFLAVWMLYVADRLLDARDAGDANGRNDLEERHYFHHQHRRRFLWSLAVVAPMLACLVPRLEPAAMPLYATLATLLAAYFLLIHVTLRSSRRLPKELAVGVFFAAAIFIPTVAKTPSLRLVLLPYAVIFAATCTLNCLYLYLWEHPRDRDAAHGTTQFAMKHLRAITLGLIATQAVVALVDRQPRIIAVACALSTCALFVLHRCRRKITRLHLRAAADLALLTPLLLLPFLR